VQRARSRPLRHPHKRRRHRPGTTPGLAGYTLTSRTSRRGRLSGRFQGMTLYYFTKDTNSKSNATAAIVQVWPVFYAAACPVPGAAEAGDFQIITRDDGTMQTTYLGWPLYYYAQDQAAGDTRGRVSIVYGSPSVRPVFSRRLRFHYEAPSAQNAPAIHQIKFIRDLQGTPVSYIMARGISLYLPLNAGYHAKVNITVGGYCRMGEKIAKSFF